MMQEKKNLSESAQAIQNILSQQGLLSVVIELASSTRTASDAAKTLACEVAQIIKSLLFRTVETEQAVLILASGKNRVNEKIIEELIDEKIVKADADFTRKITGFAIGGVPPIGHQQRINYIFIDEDLMEFDKLWAAAGTPNAVFSLQPNDLQSLTNGQLIAIK